MEYPTRFREAEARGAKLGRPLRLLTGIGSEVDEALMARLGAALLERDEPGAALAQAIRTRAVIQAELRTALHEGLDAVPGAPPELEHLIAEVNAVPDWVDWELVDRGARVLQRMGPNAHDVLEQLSLVGGYRFGGPTDVLAATGGLTGSRTRRRLAETQHWTIALAEPGSLRPGGEAWRLTVHVRVMHAMVNAGLEPTWDVGRWGVPINQYDQAGTLGLFAGTPLLACRALGMPISGRDSRAFMHLWKVVGRLLGVAPDLLTDDEKEGHRINYHILLAAPALSDAGPKLAQAVYDAVATRRFQGWPERLLPLRGRFEQERFLSMLTGFVGISGMRDLGLPVRPPWAFAYVVPLNVLRYRIVDRLPGGRRRRERWGRDFSARLVSSYFAGEEAGVGPLTP
jgi:hypothetical protein